MTKYEMIVKANSVLDRYQARRLPDGLEPDWVHPTYLAVRDWLNGGEDEEFVRSFLESCDYPDGQLADCMFGLRIVEDGWKVGTTSWVFERRNERVPVVYNGWVILHRDVSPAILEVARRHGLPDYPRIWIAIHPHKPIGSTAMSGEEIGPCQSRIEVMEWIDEEEVSPV